MAKPQYSVERIQSLLAELAEFNSHSLADVVLTQNGLPLPIPAEVLDEWRVVGMSNQCFVEIEYWTAASRHSQR
jgi:hypothetical protein